MKEKLTDEELLQHLRLVGENLGRRPVASDMCGAKGTIDVGIYIRQFGSWQKATLLAGFEPRTSKRRPTTTHYTDAELIKILQDFAKKLGHTPKAREMGNGTPSNFAYRMHFGTWLKALEAAGLKQAMRSYTNRKTFSDDDLLDLLRWYAVEYGCNPSISKVNACESMPSATTFVKHFGSWSNALKLAGLEYDRSRTSGWQKYTDGEMLSLLREFADRLSYPPRVIDLMYEEDMPCSSTYINRFGSWGRALRLAGISTVGKPDWTVVIEEHKATRRRRAARALVDFAKKIGHIPTSSEANELGLVPCVRTYYRYFETWEKALAAAGLIGEDE